MSGPETGKYWIRLVADPKPFVGVEPVPVPVKPVVTAARDNIWTVTKLDDGNYTLILEESGTPLFIQDDEGKLVGSEEPPPFHWNIRGEDGGPYTIEVPSGIRPTRGWTVNDPEPRLSPVTINYIEIPRPNQQWTFTRFPN